MSTNITKRLRGIWHAWHFQFALSLVFKVLCRNLCIACLHPLTRRYVFLTKGVVNEKAYD
ncbi:DUF3265 domain-containing protein [Vibrio parahaemolyticus]|nr:DUF3265 domain-containing protein [Vibrio parahaemolyticus]EGQ7784150.1 DUF3265 domain-containing protein [Vibrio parahaemolyticus]EKH9213240.1 DUF3265 domain-containing protein [Vibrio parahaemolyticus]MBY4651978.1 DUF3265 domain-containing protein [Vibrio parahaemolyticus]MDF4367168.1 DUF3265 domain-containing protein [Vibrio parahaemolyticus]MDF4623692.1 DUF3265 domain-containing protein [Vibrio parahaemolyticus]